MAALLPPKFRRFAHRNALKDERGVAAIEFAMVCPILVMLLLGIICYGIEFGIMHSVQELASTAARASVGGLSDTERESIARSTVASALPNYQLLRADKLTVNFSVDPANSQLYRVKLRYDPSYIGFQAFSGLIAIANEPFERDAVVRRGGY